MRDIEKELKQMGVPTVDFDNFHFENHGYNYQVAKELSVMLLISINVEELRNYFDDDTKDQWPSIVGSGNTGWNMSAPSCSAQWAILASMFSSYARKQHSGCFLSLYEYQCIKDLLVVFEEELVATHREALHLRDIKLLKEFCKEFKEAYLKDNPEYIFDILREEAVK